MIQCGGGLIGDVAGVGSLPIGSAGVFWGREGYRHTDYTCVYDNPVEPFSTLLLSILHIARAAAESVLSNGPLVCRCIRDGVVRSRTPSCS